MGLFVKLASLALVDQTVVKGPLQVFPLRTAVVPSTESVQYIALVKGAQTVAPLVEKEGYSDGHVVLLFGGAFLSGWLVVCHGGPSTGSSLWFVCGGSERPEADVTNTTDRW